MVSKKGDGGKDRSQERLSAVLVVLLLCLTASLGALPHILIEMNYDYGVRRIVSVDTQFLHRDGDRFTNSTLGDSATTDVIGAGQSFDWPMDSSVPFDFSISWLYSRLYIEPKLGFELKFDGGVPGENAGWNVTLLDLNDDGHHDVVIGAPGYDDHRGVVYIFFGSGLDAENGAVLTPADANVTIYGDDEGDRFGWSVADAGDFSDNGVSDLVVGAPGNQSDTGAVYVFQGKVDWSGVDGEDAEDAADVILTGQGAGDEFGHAVGGGADLTDATNIFVGSPGYDDHKGKVYVYQESGVPVPVLNITGKHPGDRFGHSLAGIRSVTTDSGDFTDLIVGAPHAPHGEGPGRAYIFYGGLAEDIDLYYYNANVTLVGESDGDLFGWSVFSAGDVNDDDHGDVIVGAPGYDNRTGRAYVYFGSGGMDTGVTMNTDARFRGMEDIEQGVSAADPERPEETPSRVEEKYILSESADSHDHTNYSGRVSGKEEKVFSAGHDTGINNPSDTAFASYSNDIVGPPKPADYETRSMVFRQESITFVSAKDLNFILAYTEEITEHGRKTYLILGPRDDVNLNNNIKGLQQEGPVTYSYTGSSLTINITGDGSGGDDINFRVGTILVEMSGAGGGGGYRGYGGDGGYLKANISVHAFEEITVWIGQGGIYTAAQGATAGGWGRHSGGDSGSGGYGGSGGGSTEIVGNFDKPNEAFLAAADAGGGGADSDSGDQVGGGGGARGGSGGTGSQNDGQDADGVGFGGAGGDGLSGEQDGEHGGQEVSESHLIGDAILTTGGGSSGAYRANGDHGSISITYYEFIPTETKPATDVTPTTARLQGNLTLPVGEERGDVYFKYRKYGDTSWVTTASEEKTESSEFSREITGLDPLEKYEFKAMTDMDGMIYHGDVLVFVTGYITRTTQIEAEWEEYVDAENLTTDGDDLILPNEHALEFDGSTSRVNIGNQEALRITGDQTIEMWLYPASFNARRNPYEKAYGGEGTITQEHPGSGHNTAFLSYFYGTGGGDTTPWNGYYTSTQASDITINTWYHVAVVRDLTNMKVRWYINGTLDSETDAVHSSAATSTKSVLIGDGYETNYHGKINEVRVWNVARTQSEIQENMSKKLTGTESGLAGYWGFNEGSGGTAHDLTPNENHGTITAASWDDLGYYTHIGDGKGYRISQPLSLEGIASDSVIIWNSTEPTNSSIVIYTAVSGSNTVIPTEWELATNGTSIADIVEDGDLTGKYLWVKQYMNTTNTSVTPRLHDLSEAITCKGLILEGWSVVPSGIEPDESVTIEGNVRNLGGDSESDTVRLYIDDVLVDSDSVTDLAAYATDSVSFTYEDTETVKIYSVRVELVENSRTWNSSFTVFSEMDKIISGNHSEYSGYGWNITYADITDNGYNETIIGAPFNSSVLGDVPEAGAVYIFFGYAQFTDEGDLFPENADVVIYGTISGGHFGWDVAGVGDVTDDGYPDVVVGAPDTANGTVYVIPGGLIVDTADNGGVLYADDALIFNITGEKAGDKFGASLSDAGVFGSNTLHSFVVGAWNASEITDPIEYEFTGSSVKIDVSGVTRIDVEMWGSGGGGAHGDIGTYHAGGDGGYVMATLDVSDFDEIEIWVGEGGKRPPAIDTVGAGGWGLHEGGNGRFGKDGFNRWGGSGGGGGSTEIWANGIFLAAADAGGGGSYRFDASQGFGGGGGARGGIAGTGPTGDGHDAQGSGFGGDGGNFNNVGNPGGGEVNATYVIGSYDITSGGHSDSGGSRADGDDGLIKITYYFSSRVYIFHGDSSLPTEAADADIILNGTAPGDMFGFSVAGGGDFFGEGGPDLIVGAPGANKVYVYNGSDMDYNITISGAEGEDFGWSVAFAGNFLGVGNDTIAIGAPGSANGTVYLYYYDNEVVESGDEIEGESTGDRFGYSISAGDVDLDGKTDLIVGAPYNDEGGANAGRVYFFRGNDTVPDNATSAPYRWTGPGAGNHTGWAVAHVGFIGDVDPIAVGSPGWYDWNGNVTVVGLEVGLGEVNVTFRVITQVGDALTESNNITITIGGVEYYLWDGQNVSGYFNKSLSYSFSLTSGESDGTHRWARAGMGEDGSDPFEGVLTCNHHETNITVFYYEQYNNTAGVEVDDECCPFPEGYALEFDGSDSVSVDYTIPQDTFSFGAWVKTSETINIYEEANTGIYATDGTQNKVFRAVHGWDHGAGAGLSVGTNGIQVIEHGSGYMPAIAVYESNIGSDWNHIMIVYDSKTPTIYLNGQPVHTGLQSQRGVVNASNVFGSGAYSGFSGFMDDVRIYDSALSSSDIEDIYNNRYVALGDEVGWWPMNEGEGSIVYDRSGNDNHGTITGATWEGLGSDVLFIRYTRFNSTVHSGLGAGLTSDYAFIWSDVDTDVIWDETVYREPNQRWHLVPSQSAEETADGHGNDWNKTYMHQMKVTFLARRIADNEEISGVEVSYYQFGVLETDDTGFSDWADCGSGYAYANPQMINANERWFSRSDNLTGEISSETISIAPEYYRQWRVEFGVETEGTTSMDADNHIRVTYDWCELENLTAPIYDGNSVSVWVNDGGSYNYTHTSSDSIGTHRWYSSLAIDSDFQGIVEESESISCTYYEQWYVEFGATTVGTNDMTVDNHTRVTYDWGTSSDNLTAPIYDGNSVSVWVNDGGNYNYTHTSSASTGTHRWYSSLAIDSDFLGTVESAAPISCTYYEQWYVEFGATTVGTNKMIHGNHTRVTYDWGTFSNNVTAPIYDGNSVSVWVNDGGNYNFTRFSSDSISTHRWYSDEIIDPENYTGVISFSDTIVCTYYEQWNVSFSYHNALGSDPVVIPLKYFNGSVEKNGEATVAGNWTWADDGSIYTYDNPHVITPDQERWYTGSGNRTGTVLASITISPIYYHQFYITVHTSGGYLDVTYFSTLYWYNLSVQDSLSIYDASPRSAWMDYNSEFSVETPVSGPGDRNLRFVCDDPTSTANESRTHTFLFHAEFDADVEIQGPEEGAQFGWAVSGTADFDGTGHGDIVVGAPGFDGDRGRTYLFYSEGGWTNGLQLGVDDAYTNYTGESANDRFGHSLSNPGDVFGNGLHSVLMGAPYHDSLTGRSYLYEPGLWPNVTLEFENNYDVPIGEVTFDISHGLHRYDMEVPLFDDYFLLEGGDYVILTISVNQVRGYGEIVLHYGCPEYNSHYQMGGEEETPVALTMVVKAYKNDVASEFWVTEYAYGETALVKANITALDGDANSIAAAEVSLISAQGDVIVDYVYMPDLEASGSNWKLFNATIDLQDDPKVPGYVEPGLYKIVIRAVDANGLRDDIYGETNDRMVWIRVVGNS